jgi:radical SAM protein with 4Fe4S-binding SPASM domain
MSEITRFVKQRPQIYYLVLTGGEPLVRDDLTEIVIQFIENCGTCFVTLPTNGSFPTRLYHFVNDIKKRHPEVSLTVQLSIEAFGDDLDRIRGSQRSGKYDRMIRQSADNLQSLKECWPNLFIQISTVITSDNLPGIDTICRRIHDEFVFDYHLLLPDRNLTNLPEGFQIDDYLNLVDQYCKSSGTKSVRFRRPYLIVRERALRNAVRVFCRNLRRPEKANSCGAGKHFAVIDQEGNIFPCEPFMQSPLASIRDKAFRWGDLWESPRMKSFDREITKNKCQCNWFCSTMYSLPQFTFTS